MTWYFTDLPRFRAEREALEAYARGVDWLTPIGWRMDASMRLVMDADIAAGGRVYPVFLQYPTQFPDTPPSVFPRGDTTRWSNHQFEAGGELCLEFGPDNWTPDMTGVQMIESAHRLLEGENPAPNEKSIVASRHVSSLGQRLRAESIRLLVTRELAALFAGVPAGVPLMGNLLASFHKGQIVNIIDKITLADGQAWIDEGLPKHLSHELMERPVGVFRVPEGAGLPPTASLTAFKPACAAMGFGADHTYAVILRGAAIRAYFLWSADNTVSEVGVIPAQPVTQRLDAGHEALKAKHVALIGCGSLGSKVGTMLARAGVGRFFLIDDDVLMPDNFVRNDLDWRDVGSHKADGLARRMQLVHPSVQTHVRRAQFAGQESSGSAETVLTTLAECDLIFDATANPDVLNLASTIAKSVKKAVLWAEVFGGGIGGLIARCRPGLEPAPQYMRRAIENWFAQNGPPPVRSRRRYEAGQDSDPLIADDADVSVIAAHAARLAIDTLIEREPSLFPHSVYAIGLGAGSVFTQPFDTFPIDVGPAPEAEPKVTLSPEEIATEVAKIIDLFKARVNEAAPAPEGDQTPQA